MYVCFRYLQLFYFKYFSIIKYYLTTINYHLIIVKRHFKFLLSHKNIFLNSNLTISNDSLWTHISNVLSQMLLFQMFSFQISKIFINFQNKWDVTRSVRKRKITLWSQINYVLHNFLFIFILIWIHAFFVICAQIVGK